MTPRTVNHELQIILSQLQHRDPPFQRPPLDLETHLRQWSGEVWDGTVEGTLQRIVREQILVLAHGDATPEGWSLDEDYLHFVKEMGPGTLARTVRIFSPLASSDPSQANLQYHTNRLRNKFLTIHGDEEQRGRLLVHRFPLDRLVVFGRLAQEPIWFAFGCMMQEDRYRTCVFALHETVEKTPPPMVVSRSGFVGFLRRVCGIPGQEDDDDDEDDWMASIMRYFEQENDDDDDDHSEDERETESVRLEFRPHSEAI